MLDAQHAVPDAPRIVDEFAVEIEALSDEGAYPLEQNREVDSRAGLETEIDKVATVAEPFLEAIRTYQLARGYHQSVNGALLTRHWREWAEKELIRFDKEGSLTSAMAEVQRLNQDEAIQEEGAHPSEHILGSQGVRRAGTPPPVPGPQGRGT